VISVYDSRVIRRLYINNYRCLENFDLPIAGKQSVLLIGKNGSGKTTVGRALRILQRIAQGTNRVGELVKPRELTRQRTDVPMRFELEVQLNGQIYSYTLVFELPKGFKELRVQEEGLKVDGDPVYTRELAQVHLVRPGEVQGPSFRIDWHLVALPIIQQDSQGDPLFVFKQWLGRMLVLRPVPTGMHGTSEHENEVLQPSPFVSNYGSWFSGLLAHSPSVYSKIDAYLKQVMPDLKDIQNPVVGEGSRSLLVQFSNKQGTVSIPFQYLADGEKCFMVCALVLAAADVFRPLLCYWDEPDNYLALDEVGFFILALRKAFESDGQFIGTSHNPEAIRRFSDETTLLLYRNSHLEPTIIRPVSELQITGDLIGALIRGDVEPQQ
jgi:predicted ATPase